MKSHLREMLLEKLVTSGHLNVEERQALGKLSVSFNELAYTVERVLSQTGFFPPNARPWRTETAVHEPALIERTSDGRFRLVLQRGLATNPFVLAEQRTTEYADVGSAIRAFISVEWPDGIDGIPIV